MTYSSLTKTILITGASEGIGAECARLFSKTSSNLVLVARTKSNLDTLVRELSEDCNIISIPMDVGSIDDCNSLFERIENQFGCIDVLINNAGMHERGDFQNLNVESIVKTVDVNLRAPLVLSSMAIPLMRKPGKGSIVMVASLAGMSPLQGAAIYSSTKAGLRAFAYALHDELRESNIHVGIVSPGPVETGFIMNSIDDVEDIVFSQPMSSPQQVARAIKTVSDGEKLEIAIPKMSGVLATMAYLFPKLRRAMRPGLYAKGKKNKEKYKREKGNE